MSQRARRETPGSTVNRQPLQPIDLTAFEQLVHELVGDIPPEYLEGIAAIDVSPRTVRHPTQPGVYTLGECIPVHGDADETVSRVVLYHGSFRALAQDDPAFSWHDEAWETLTHELRHHVEWRANADALERYDWAVEQNYLRHEGRPFEPTFPTAGIPIGIDCFRVEDDVFLDRPVRSAPERVAVEWRGGHYDVPVPDGVSLPAFLTLVGIDDPPSGEIVLVLRQRPGWRTLLARRAEPSGAVVRARRVRSPEGT